MPSVPKNLRVMARALARRLSASSASARSRPASGAARWRRGTARFRRPARTPPGLAKPRANGTNAVCAVHSCHASPISSAFLRSCSADADQRQDQRSRRRAPAPWAWRRRIKWTIAHKAKPHIIGWRVIANTPVGPLVRARAPGSAGLPTNEPTNRIEPSHISRRRRSTPLRPAPTTAARRPIAR